MYAITTLTDEQLLASQAGAKQRLHALIAEVKAAVPEHKLIPDGVFSKLKEAIRTSRIFNAEVIRRKLQS